MIRDLLIAEKKQHEVCLIFEDKSKYIGKIEMSADRERVKIKHQKATEWIPLHDIVSCSTIINGSF
ncbi:hypothetical protein HUB98_03685 [Paenibacillus barcinonensis]|uniref:YolD-like protein n=1 Tax=Paenibacillus barcinonensis TaxID=198119 RepID=A0A2V4WNJ0_PAEBA|nr:hypothetical protein [Paenibacillus barcinonensis]PYE49282.1 hypothetical protein DFQ00_106265 [Paenibacillus barcinonensis]QKS55502.1 hypothetical protein HUB98_03685 [Paenibacillus barcinonensis]